MRRGACTWRSSATAASSGDTAEGDARQEPDRLQQEPGARSSQGIGLRRIRHTVELQDTPATRGMIHKVRHLVRGRMTVDEPMSSRTICDRPKGAKHAKKRVGRGPGSGHGKTAGRGHKGAKSRSGFKFKRGFEGGQMPLHRRVPKRGFTICSAWSTRWSTSTRSASVRRRHRGDAGAAARARPRAGRDRPDQGARPRRHRQDAHGAGAQVQRQGGARRSRRPAERRR